MLSGGKATEERESTHVAEIHRSHCNVNGNEPWIDRGDVSAAEQLALKRRVKIRHNHPPPSSLLKGRFVRNVQEASKRVNESSNKPIITSITNPSPTPTPSIEHKTAAPQIDVKVAQTNVESAGDRFDLTIWDCGGQVEYYAAHQVLLSATSIFILLVDLTSTPSPSDRLIEWTRALYSRIDPEQLMVVFSKADLVDDALSLVDDALKACAKNGLPLMNRCAIISNTSSGVDGTTSLADVRSQIIAMCASHLRKLAKKRVCI